MSKKINNLFLISSFDDLNQKEKDKIIECNPKLETKGLTTIPGKRYVYLDIISGQLTRERERTEIYRIYIHNIDVLKRFFDDLKAGNKVVVEKFIQARKSMADWFASQCNTNDEIQGSGYSPTNFQYSGVHACKRFLISYLRINGIKSFSRRMPFKIAVFV